MIHFVKVEVDRLTNNSSYSELVQRLRTKFDLRVNIFIFQAISLAKLYILNQYDDMKAESLLYLPSSDILGLR